MSGVARTALVLLAPFVTAAISACQPELSSVEIGVEGIRSFVATYFQGDELVRVLAVDVPDGQTFMALPRLEGATIHTTEFTCSLAEAGLAAGPLSPDPAGNPLRRPLRRRSSRGDQANPADWMPGAALPAGLGELRLGGTWPSACRDYAESSHATLEVSVYGAALVGIAEPKLVIRTERGFERYDPRTLLFVDTLAVPPGAPSQAVGTSTLRDPGSGAAYFFSSRGDYFKIGEDGAIEYSAATTSSTDAPSLRQSTRVAGPRSGDPIYDVFLTTEKGTQDHFDGRGWTPVARTPARTVPQASGVAWLGPGRALLVTGASLNTVLYVDGDTQRIEKVYPEGSAAYDGGLRSVVDAGWIEALSAPAVFDNRGGIWVRSPDGKYSALPVEPEKTNYARVQALHSQGHLMFYVGGGHLGPTIANARLAQYDDELGACDDNPIIGATHVRSIFPLGGGDLLVFGYREAGGLSAGRVTLLTRTGGPQRCDGTDGI